MARLDGLDRSRGDMTEADKSRQEKTFVALFVVLRSSVADCRSVLRVRSLDTVAARLLELAHGDRSTVVKSEKWRN